MRDFAEQVKALREGAEWAKKLCAHETAKRQSDAADAIEELLATVPTWISVEERLPEDEQWLLVWGHGQKIPTMMFRESGAWIDDQFEFHTTITHWMPLPAPPKEVLPNGDV